ncbi:MAG: hypothetical protein ABSE99_18065 [Terracidiphilus sp.]
MKKKHFVTIFCIIVGGSSVLAVGVWPQYAAVIQMTLYTIMVFVPVFLGLWPERNRRVFWGSMSSAIIMHGLFLYMIRSTFPFRTILVVIPIVLIEASVIYVAMDKVLGDRRSL